MHIAPKIQYELNKKMYMSIHVQSYSPLLLYITYCIKKSVWNRFDHMT